MKNLLAILAVVLLGTIFANAQTNSVYTTVTCASLTVTSGFGDLGTALLPISFAAPTPAGTAVGNLVWNYSGDGTGKTTISGTPVVSSGNGNGVTLAVGSASGSIAGNCNATGTVTAAATITVASDATSGAHTFVVTLTTVN